MLKSRDLQPLLDVQQNHLNLIFSDGSTIDTKALTILATNIALVIFIAQSSSGLHAWQQIVVYAPFIISFALDILSIWPRRYVGAVNLEKSPGHLHLEREALILQLLADTQAAITHNNQLNKERLRYCLISTGITCLGLVIVLGIL